ncbi:hypothetical protein AB0333_12110 [Citricoccus sp. NPDC079358]|uniref:hypothetical protein n=1 Tax=Citricoccus sp. NPDC079358 TaxID=3154653 RepID=UPI00344F147D
MAVPATAEEVWESVATGPGYRRWFVEAELEPRVGGTLVTHHGDFGDSEGTLPGWRSALRLLAEFHTHFAGRQTAQALVMREVPAGHRLTVLLGLDGAVVGQQATARAEAGGRHLAVTGMVIEASGGPTGEGPTQQDSVVLRVADGAAPGVYEFGTMQYGETRMSVVRGYLHVPADADPGVAEAAQAARAVEHDWAAVLDALLA